MALTKISRSLLDTGVSDSSDATAITIDSSENVGIGVTTPFSQTQITETGWSSGAPYGTVLTVTGNNTNDLGLILERGNTGDNVFIGWDESQDRVRFATTTDSGGSTGNLTLTNANIQAGRLYGDVTGALTGNASTATALATARSIALAGDVTASGVNFDGTGNISLTTVIDSDGINHLKTDDLPEGSSNLYHTTARARGAVSVTDAGGDGSLSYNSSNGVFTYTGPSASEVRAHLTANKGLSVSSGEFNIDSANVRGMFSGGTGITYNSGTGAITTTDGDIVHDNLSGFVANEHINHANVSITAGTGLTGGGTIASTRTLNVVGGKGITANANDIQIDSANVLGMFSAGGDLSYNSGTGQFSFTDSAQHTSAQIRAMFSASGDLSYNSGTGAFSITKFTTANARSAISAGGDLSYNSSTGVMSYTKQTASELLTAIKTVDGTGSGLDADTLDGQQGTHYRINVYDNGGTLLN